uniref:Uncharacterized protein n=1 Tax=Oryza punctata TaxID=4537 RepID=A0A0E0MCX3_ORYPU
MPGSYDFHHHQPQLPSHLPFARRLAMYLSTAKYKFSVVEYQAINNVLPLPLPSSVSLSPWLTFSMGQIVAAAAGGASTGGGDGGRGHNLWETLAPQVLNTANEVTGAEDGRGSSDLRSRFTAVVGMSRAAVRLRRHTAVIELEGH